MSVRKAVNPRSDLSVERVCAELHGAGDDGLGGERVQHGPVLEDDEPGHVGHDVPLLELLQAQDLRGREQQRQLQ